MKLNEAVKRMHDAYFPAPPEPVRLKRVAKKIRDTWPELQDLPTDDRDRRQILEDFLTRIKRWEWQDATFAELNRAARLAFDREFLQEERYEIVRDFILRELTLSHNCSFIATAFRIYWEGWSANSPHAEELGHLLQDIAETPGRRACLDQWQPLLERAPSLFSPLAAPGQVAVLLLETEDVMQMRRQMRLNLLPLHGLQEKALSMWLKELAKDANSPKIAYCILEWLEKDRKTAKMPRLAKHAIRALVSPWLDRECPQKLKQDILDRILDLYGDPRISRADPWPRVPDLIKERLRHWLVGADMRLFLDIIRESEESHMWSDREKFWSRLYKEGRIKEAWVAFSDEASHVVRSKYSDRNLSFGRQVVGGSRKGTSLLIMRIEKAIVVEGSHNYKVHVFCEWDPEKPTLYKDEYDCEDIRLRAKSFQQIRHLGMWQYKVMQLIRECG